MNERASLSTCRDCERCGGGGELAGFDCSGPNIGTCPVCKGTGKRPLDDLAAVEALDEAIYEQTGRHPADG